MDSLLKIEFPKFDGSNLRNWVYRCGKYFTLYEISEKDQLNLACMNVIGKAHDWLAEFTIRSNWDFTELFLTLFSRFPDYSDVKRDGKYIFVSQLGSLEDYINDFYMSLMSQHGHSLSRNFVLESFVVGLDDYIRWFVELKRPYSIIEAIRCARMGERFSNILEKKSSSDYMLNNQVTVGDSSQCSYDKGVEHVVVDCKHERDGKENYDPQGKEEMPLKFHNTVAVSEHIKVVENGEEGEGAADETIEAACDCTTAKEGVGHVCEYFFKEHSKFVNSMSNFNKLSLYILPKFNPYEKSYNKFCLDFDNCSKIPWLKHCGGGNFTSYIDSESSNIKNGELIFVWDDYIDAYNLVEFHMSWRKVVLGLEWSNNCVYQISCGVDVINAESKGGVFLLNCACMKVPIEVSEKIVLNSANVGSSWKMSITSNEGSLYMEIYINEVPLFLLLYDGSLSPFGYDNKKDNAVLEFGHFVYVSEFRVVVIGKELLSFMSSIQVLVGGSVGPFNWNAEWEEIRPTLVIHLQFEGLIGSHRFEKVKRSTDAEKIIGVILSINSCRVKGVICVHAILISLKNWKRVRKRSSLWKELIQRAIWRTDFCGVCLSMGGKCDPGDGKIIEQGEVGFGSEYDPDFIIVILHIHTDFSKEKQSEDRTNEAKLNSNWVSLVEDVEGDIQASWLYVRMYFSSFGWQVECHHLYSPSFTRCDSAKLWCLVSRSKAIKMSKTMMCNFVGLNQIAKLRLSCYPEEVLDDVQCCRDTKLVVLVLWRVGVCTDIDATSLLVIGQCLDYWHTGKIVDGNFYTSVYLSFIVIPAPLWLTPALVNSCAFGESKLSYCKYSMTCTCADKRMEFMDEILAALDIIALFNIIFVMTIMLALNLM